MRVLYFSILLSILQYSSAELNDDWFKHLVIYQIYPRSFKDSNNDGIGDLQGVISKLDYLKETGIDAIWLNPIQPSPMIDAGYDISDYKDVDPTVGTLDDFDELVNKCRELGIKLILDFVAGYNSYQNQWFINSENNVSGYEDWYVWRDSPNDTLPNNWISLFKQTAWTYSEIRKQWYFHQFAPRQPDLNYRSSGVSAAMKDVLTFWLDRGVDGFRMDAIAQLVEDAQFRDEPLADGYDTYDVNNYECLNHIYSKNQIEAYWEVYGWRAHLDKYSKEHGKDKIFMVTEAYENTNLTMMYYGNETSEGASCPFNFRFITNLNQNSKAQDVVWIVKEWLDNVPEGRLLNWVLGNHDQHRIATRLGSDRVDGFNMFSLLLPGISFTYMGEEIGMEDGEVSWEEAQDPQACNTDETVYFYYSRDFTRTPYLWDNTTNAGFNEGNKTWLPVSSKYTTINLKDQMYPEDKKSHYHVYKNLVALRKQEPFLNGNTTVDELDEYVVGFSRSAEGYDTYLVIFNLGVNSTIVNLKEKFSNITNNLVVVIPSSNSERNINDYVESKVILDPYESLVLKVMPTSPTVISVAANFAVANVVLILASLLIKMF